MTTYEAICKMIDLDWQDYINARRRHTVAIERDLDTGQTARTLVKARKRYDERVAEKERMES
jgi:hypothetical protein